MSRSKAEERLSFSFSATQARKLEKALAEVHALTGDIDIENMHRMVESRVFRHEAKGTIPKVVAE
jgi:hypothetical protein